MRKWDTDSAEYGTLGEVDLLEKGWEPFSVAYRVRQEDGYDNYVPIVFFRRLVEDQQNLIDPSPISRGEETV